MTATEARRGDVAAVLAIIKWRKEEDEEEEGVIAPLLTTVGRSWAGIAGAPSSESSPVKGAFNYGVEFVKSLAHNSLPPPPLRPPPKPISRACGAREGSPSSLAKSHRTNERTHTHVLTHLGKRKEKNRDKEGRGETPFYSPQQPPPPPPPKFPCIRRRGIQGEIARAIRWRRRRFGKKFDEGQRN